SHAQPRAGKHDHEWKQDKAQERAPARRSVKRLADGPAKQRPNQPGNAQIEPALEKNVPLLLSHSCWTISSCSDVAVLLCRSGGYGHAARHFRPHLDLGQVFKSDFQRWFIVSVCHCFLFARELSPAANFAVLPEQASAQPAVRACSVP